MPKYINADELKKRLSDDDVQFLKLVVSNEKMQSLEELIDEMPADVVDVVRCKDCKYFEVDTYITQNNYLECGDCDFHTVRLRKWGDDFCSRGERSDDKVDKR